MWAVPDPSHVILSHQKCPSSFGTEQVVILTLSGKDMSQGLSLLHRLLIDGPKGYGPRAGFELLGLKWLPTLTRLQAQELSPYEAGEQLCHGSVDTLLSSPALVCALRATDAFASLRELLPHSYPRSLSVLMSPTPEVALRQTRLFFSDREITPGRRTLLTACVFKPRDWSRALAEILRKIRQRGLVLVGLRVLNLDESDAASLLPTGREQCLCSGSSVALCLRGEDAVEMLLDMLRKEDSSLWINCYGSASHQQAVKDVKRLFPEALCCIDTVNREEVLSLYSDPSASVEREQSCTLNHAAQESLPTSIISELNTVPECLADRAVWQTTCLLIPLNVPPRSQAPSQLEMVEQLLRSGCHLVAGRMSAPDEEHRRRVAETLAASASGRARATHLHTAPCLILALQGEEIVAGFRLILKSISKERPDLEVVAKTVVYPESDKEAKQLIRYLFGLE